jgi:hypothetical protein
MILIVHILIKVGKLYGSAVVGSTSGGELEGSFPPLPENVESPMVIWSDLRPIPVIGQMIWKR